MKLSQNFIVHNTDSESLLVPTGDASFSGIVRGNETLGAILKALQTETDEASIVEAICRDYDAPADKVKVDVEKALAELRKIGALDE